MPRPRPAQLPDLDRLEEMHAHAAEAARLMKALGNEQRLLILCNLLERPLSVSE
jgi:ArsR family transcriptional regulator, virulence genes transcriptional regulator